LQSLNTIIMESKLSAIMRRFFPPDVGKNYSLFNLVLLVASFLLLTISPACTPKKNLEQPVASGAYLVAPTPSRENSLPTPSSEANK
jgi:hypothetical protein